MAKDKKEGNLNLNTTFLKTSQPTDDAPNKSSTSTDTPYGSGNYGEGSYGGGPYKQQTNIESNYNNLLQPQLSATDYNPQGATEADITIPDGISNQGKIPTSKLMQSKSVKVTGQDIETVPNFGAKTNDDKIGYKEIASAIYSIAANFNIKAPFNIGIIGKYGSGKSTVIEQLKNILNNTKKNKRRASLLGRLANKFSFPTQKEPKDAFSKEKLLSALDKYVEYDVGRYHESNVIWASLIAQFFSSFSLYHRFTGAIRYSFSSIDWSFNRLLRFVLGILLTAFSIWWTFQTTPEKIKYFHAAFTTIVNSSAFIWVTYKIFRIWNSPLVKNAFVGFGKYPPTHSVIKDRIILEEQLSCLFKTWLRKDEKVILFIDNLDRCDPKRVLSIVDELFALMNACIVSKHLVCIIAVDEDQLHFALDKQRRTQKLKMDYFEKLFTLKILLPRIDNVSLRHFLEDSIGLQIEEQEKKGETLPDGENDAELTQLEKQVLFDEISKLVNRNETTPRKINRIIFAYQFIKFLWARYTPEAPHFFHNSIITALCKSAISEKLDDNTNETIKKYIKMVPINFFMKDTNL